MSVLLEYLLIGNLILFLAFLVVVGLEIAFNKTSLRYAYKLRLNLAIAALSASLLPMILAPFSEQLSKLFNMNVTDILVSQYLKGNIHVSATELSDIISAKNTLVNELIGPTSMASVLLISAFFAALTLRSAYIALNIWRIRNLVVKSTPFKSTKHVDLIISKEIDVPFSTRGFWRKYIVLPHSMMDKSDAVRIAIQHEAQHIRQHDVNWEIFLSFLSPIFCLNPAFWFIADRIRRFREYSCDASVLGRNRLDAREYCLMLVNIAEMANVKGKQNSIALASSVPFFGRDGIFNKSAKSALSQRVLAMANSQKMPHRKLQRVINILPAICLALLMVMSVSLLAKPSDWSHDRLMLSTVVNLERLDRINGFGVAPN